MSAMTNRQKAAAELRRYGLDEMKGNSLLKTLKAVTGGGSWRDVLIELAYLIDPTCSIAAEVDDDDFAYIKCSACGEVPENMIGGDPDLWREWDCCPSCGARIERDDG